MVTMKGIAPRNEIGYAPLGKSRARSTLLKAGGAVATFAVIAIVAVYQYSHDTPLRMHGAENAMGKARSLRHLHNNLAFGRTANQSTTFDENVATQAVNGLSDCSQTSWEWQPWWRLDLETSTQIEQIVVRGKCSTSNGDNCRFNVLLEQEVITAGESPKGFSFVARNGEKYRQVLNLDDNIVANYVLVEQTNPGSLILCDVAVMGESVEAVEEKKEVTCEGNTAPSIKIKAGKTDSWNNKVTLDADETTDTEEQTMSYVWTLRSTPKDSTLTSVDLVNSYSKNSWFIPDEIGHYLVSLKVTDSCGAESEDSAVIMFEEKECRDKTSIKAYLTGADGFAKETLVLDAASSISVNSVITTRSHRNVDAHPIYCKWRVTSKPDGSEADDASFDTEGGSDRKTGCVAQFLPDVAGEYAVEVVVAEEECGAYDFATTTFTVAEAPTCTADEAALCDTHGSYCRKLSTGETSCHCENGYYGDGHLCFDEMASTLSAGTVFSCGIFQPNTTGVTFEMVSIKTTSNTIAVNVDGTFGVMMTEADANEDGEVQSGELKSDFADSGIQLSDENIASLTTEAEEKAAARTSSEDNVDSKINTEEEYRAFAEFVCRDLIDGESMVDYDTIAGVVGNLGFDTVDFQDVWDDINIGSLADEDFFPEDGECKPLLLHLKVLPKVEKGRSAYPANVACWGRENSTQIEVPDQAVRSVSSGYAHSCGVSADYGDKAVCWGSDVQGQVTVPDEVSESSFVSICAGGWHTCGVQSSGSIACWGNNEYNQTSDAPSTGHYKQVTCGYYHTCALTTNGKATCWGRSDHNRLKVATNGGDDIEFTLISAGGEHTCGLFAQDGAVACWGRDQFWQSTPPANRRFKFLSAGGAHTCGTSADGRIECWGANADGQITTPFASTGFRNIASGDAHTCALSHGEVQCWGYNEDGQSTPPTDFDSVSP